MADHVKFTALEEVMRKITDGDYESAGLLIKAFSDDLAKYEEAVRLILESQAKAVDNLIVASKKTSKMLLYVTPEITGAEEEASSRWLKRFHDMCERLGTDDFELVEDGKVFLENKSIMFKGSTLQKHMQDHYGKFPQRHHFDIARTLLGAESSSVARKHFRSRVWVVKTKDAEKHYNEEF